MRRLVRAGARAFTALAGLAVVVTAPGWFYLVKPRGGVPGPSIADALPLDELPHRSGVPLLAFVAVWATAGLTLGMLARVARVERLSAALTLALAVGSYSFAATGLSLFVVRQIPALEAFHAAARMPAVYLPAALAGLGGALIARRQTRKRLPAPVLLALLVGLAGVLDLVVAIIPETGGGLVERLAPHAVQGISEALLAPLGVGLLLTARGLLRRKRRAWQLAVALLGGSGVVHLLHSVDYGATAVVLVALGLIARRDDFDVRGDRERSAHLARLGLVLVLFLYGYGAAALWANRLMADQSFGAAFALRETSAALVGATLRGSGHLGGSFGHWFPVSVFALGLTCAGILLPSWLAPWRYRLRNDRRERQQAENLVARFGDDTLAPFALRADKSYFFSEDERAFLAYKVVTGIAVVAGDPVGPHDATPELLHRFLAFTHERDWRVAVLGASESTLHHYRAAGLRAMYHGEEAVVQTSEFSLDGRAIRKVRQSVARLEREGYRADVLHAGEVDETLRIELKRLFDEWRGDNRVKGFTMELDSLFRLDNDNAVFVIGRDANDVPQGFLHFVVAAPGRALSLSSMPRRRSTPNGLNEWLVVTLIDWAKERGFERVSLNFAPFAALLSRDGERLSAGERLQRLGLDALKGHGFQLENLLVFNRKFFPRWERRYLVYERRSDLPRVALAGLAAEGYLPVRPTRA
jgi:lysyl-tRNA synthetase, class II